MGSTTQNIEEYFVCSTVEVFPQFWHGGMFHIPLASVDGACDAVCMQGHVAGACGRTVLVDIEREKEGTTHGTHVRHACRQS